MVTLMDLSSLCRRGTQATKTLLNTNNSDNTVRVVLAHPTTCKNKQDISFSESQPMYRRGSTHALRIVIRIMVATILRDAFMAPEPNETSANSHHQAGSWLVLIPMLYRERKGRAAAQPWRPTNAPNRPNTNQRTRGVKNAASSDMF